MHYYIGIAAVSEEPSQQLKKQTLDFIKRLEPCKDKIRLVIGGYWGLMKYIADYASSIGVNTIMILPEQPHIIPPRKREFTIIKTELGYKSRSTILVNTSDLLVCLGGRIGSIIEVMLAYSFGKPVIVLKDTGLDTDRLQKCFIDYIDSRKIAPITYVPTGRAAAEKALEILGIEC